jgi:hypothetical protein
MADELLVEWLEILQGLWIAVGKPVDDQRLKLYFEELRTIPLGLLELAIRRLRRAESVYLVVPTLGAIFKAIDKELEEANCITPEDWADSHFRKFLETSRKYPRTAPGRYFEGRLVE